MSELVEKGLTDKQAEFVRQVVSGTDFSTASLRAGYAESVCGYTLAKRPYVAAAIHFEISRRLATEAAPLALSVALTLLRDQKTGARIRADLSLKLLQMAGHGAEKGRDTGNDKPLAEMSPDELRGFIDRNQAEIDRLEGELAARAKDVSAPIARQLDAKALNYLD